MAEFTVVNSFIIIIIIFLCVFPLIPLHRLLIRELLCCAMTYFFQHYGIGKSVLEVTSKAEYQQLQTYPH